MMTYLKQIVGGAIALLAVACNQNANLLPVTDPETDPATIKIHSEIASQIASKTPATNATALTDVCVLLNYSSNGAPTNDVTPDATRHFANRATNGTMSWSSAVSTPKYKKDNSQKAYLLAYHPGTYVDGANQRDSYVQFAINGKRDVLVAPQIDAGSYFAPSSNKLVFEHLLAQLHLVVKADASANIADLREQYGQITEISFYSYDYLNFIFNTRKTQEAGGFELLPMFTKDYTAFEAIDIPAANNALVNAAIMSVPIESGELRIRLTTAKRGGISIKAQLKNSSGANIGYAPGKVYVLTLTLTKDTQKIAVGNATIVNWVLGYEDTTDNLI